MKECNEDPNTVDLRSDTVTQPTAAMRDTMASAPVGDDVLGEDPSINELERRVAALLGKEAALFVPSGTMANLLAVLAQTRPGDSVLLSEDAHPYNYESGNLGMIAGVLTRPLSGTHGIMAPEAIEANIVTGENHHHSPTTLVMIENTTNRGGGAVWPVDGVAAAGEVARRHGLKLHCDGARIFNAAVALGISPAEYAQHVDTLSFCFSKGLGAPVGSVLAGEADTIDRAHRYRKMLGGGMRQAGILAAAALHALDHHVDRLSEDHRRAREFREGLADVLGVSFPMPSPTNIVFLDVDDAAGFVDRLAQRGVLVLATGPNRMRAVFHLDVSDDGLARAIAAFRDEAGAS
jgi:threonine aldolase